MQVLAVAGFAATVSVIYLVVILGLGRPPSDSADQRLLGLSMVAAAVAAVSFAPARERLTDWANRQVFGARQAPDEVLRTFGSRMTRAIAMDELLLQLAESLRKTMALASAEVYTGLGDVLERTAAVPDTGARSLVIGDRERPVIARAGVSGHAWASVWLPALLEADGARPTAPCCASRRSATPGELLGLIVVRRPADRPTRSPPRTTGCSPSWPVRSASRCTTRGWTPRWRPPSTSCASRPTSCAGPGRGSWRAPTPSAAGSSATCTTARSSTWSPSP